MFEIRVLTSRDRCSEDLSVALDNRSSLRSGDDVNAAGVGSVVVLQWGFLKAFGGFERCISSLL